MDDLKNDVDFVKSNLHSLYFWACWLEDGCKMHKQILVEMMNKVGEKPKREI